MNFARSPDLDLRPRPAQDFGRLDALVLQRRKAARKHGLADQRDRLAGVERTDDRPFAGALLAGGVQNLVDQRRAVLVLLGKDVARNLDQVAVELALVPLARRRRAARRRSAPARASAGRRPRRSAACRRTRCRCGPSSRSARRRLRPPSRSRAFRLPPWRQWPGRSASHAATPRDCRPA